MNEFCKNSCNLQHSCLDGFLFIALALLCSSLKANYSRYLLITQLLLFDLSYFWCCGAGRGAFN